MNTQAIHVDDKVKFRLGGRDQVGQVREDRGPIGVGGRHLYLVVYELGRDNRYSIELPADQIEVIDHKKASPGGVRLSDKRIGLTDEQVSDLRRLEDEYRAKAESPLSDKTVAFVLAYLQLLTLGGTVENMPDSPQVNSLREQTSRERAQIYREFGRHLRKTPTADGIIQELSRFVTIPAFLADAIRRDVEAGL